MNDPGDRGKQPLRLTKDVREALLRANEGFTSSTHYSGKNFTETRRYTIADGELRVNSRSNTSWADSRRQDDFVADEAATHRYLRERLPRLNTDGVPEGAAAIKAARKASDTGARASTPPPSEFFAVSHDYVYPAHDADDDEVSSAEVAGNLLALAAISALVWVAPRAGNAWTTKAKPKVKEWHARRLAKTTPQDTGSAQLDRPGDSPDTLESADDPN